MTPWVPLCVVLAVTPLSAAFSVARFHSAVPHQVRARPAPDSTPRFESKPLLATIKGGSNKKRLTPGPLQWQQVAAVVASYGAMGLLGIGVAQLLHGDPLFSMGSGFAKQGLSPLGDTLSNGVFATVPLAAFAVGTEAVGLSKRFPSLAETSNVTKSVVLVVLGSTWRPVTAAVAAFFIAASAGVAEEVIFRGVAQQELASALGSSAGGLAAASVVFGLAHFTTPVYAALASLAGLYFGWLFDHFGANASVPAVTHALYDWGALLATHWAVTRVSPDTGMSLAEYQQGILDQRDAPVRPTVSARFWERERSSD